MHIDANTQGFEMTDGLCEHARCRERFALGRIGAGVQRVVIRLSDLNGTRGGIDKRCRLRPQLTDRPELLVDTRDDLYTAIAAAQSSAWLAR